MPASSSTTASRPTSSSRAPSACAVVTSSARRSAGAAIADDEQLALDRLAGLTSSVTRRTFTSLWICFSICSSVWREQSTRSVMHETPGALRRPDGERVDVEPAAGEHRRDPVEGSGLVLDRDGQGVLHDAFASSDGRRLELDHVDAPPRPSGTIGKHCSAGSTRQSTTTVRLAVSASARAASSSSSFVDDHADPAVGLREQRVVGHVGRQVDVRAAPVEEHVLPLRDHPEVAVVDEHDDDRELLDAPR